jgi:hypothetical protein
MTKAKNKKNQSNEVKEKAKQTPQDNDQVLDAVVIEEEVIVVEDDDGNVELEFSDEQNSNEDSEVRTDNNDGFGIPDLPTPNKKVIFVLLLLVGVLGLMFLGRSWIMAATVNGKPIYRHQLISRLEKDYGKQAMDNMIREELLKQAAKSKNITVTQADVDNEFKKIDESLKSQGTSLNDALKQQNLTKEDVTESIRMQILAAKLVADRTKVSEAEIKQYKEQNKEFLPKDQSEEEINKTIVDYLRQQKEAQEIDKLINELKGKAKINQILEL